MTIVVRQTAFNKPVKFRRLGELERQTLRDSLGTDRENEQLVRLIQGLQSVPSVLPVPDAFIAALRAKILAIMTAIQSTPSAPAPVGSLQEQMNFCQLLGQLAYLALDPSWRLEWKLGPPIPSIDKGDKHWSPGGGISFPVLHEFRESEILVAHFVSIYFDQDSMAECQEHLLNTSHETATGVALLFDISRTQPLQVMINDRCPRVLDKCPGLMVFDLQPVVQPGRPAVLTARFRGDLPFLRGITWLGGEKRDLPIPDPFGTPPERIQHDSMVASYLCKFTRTPSQIADRRRELQGEDPAKAFFNDLDRGSSPDLLPASQRLKVLELAQYLQLRWEFRAQLAAAGEKPVFSAEELLLWQPLALEFAEFFRAKLDEHIPDLAAFEDAFERFAGGELTLFDSHGAPNGVYYFSFAEFGYLLRDLQLDAAYWAPRIPVLARTAEIFVRSYHVPGARRTTCAYRISANPTGRRAFTPALKADLTARWATVQDVELEFGRLIASALADDLSMASVTVTNPVGIADVLAV